MADNLPDPQLWLAAQAAAQKYGVDPDLVHQVIASESGYKPDAVSPKGAVGVMQLMPGTAKDLGVQDPRDPNQNIDGGVRYLKQLSDRFGGDRAKVAAAYNFGPNAVASGRQLPAETQAYIAKVNPAAPPRSDDGLPDVNDWLKTRGAPTPAPADTGQFVEGFLNNLAESGGRFASGLYNAITDIPGTATNLGKLGLGTVQLAVPDLLKDYFGDQRGVARGVGQNYKDRYGGLDKIGNTLYTDPVGAAADLSTLFDGAGALAGGIGKFAKLGDLGDLANVANATARGARTASDLTNPLNIVAAPAKQYARWSYGHGLAPSPSLQTRAGMNAMQMADVGLSNGIGQNLGGINKASTLQGGLMDARNATIRRASDAGVVSNAPSLMNDLQDWALNKKGLGVQPTPEAARAAVQDFVDEFGRNSGQKGFIPLDEVEALKEGAYKSHPESAFVQQPTAAKRALIDHFEGMLKGDVERGTRGFENGGQPVKDLNAQYGKLESVKQAISAEGKRNSGLGQSVSALGEMLAGQAVGHPLIGYAVAELLKRPETAQLLYRAPTAARAATPVLALQRALNDSP